MKDVRDPLFGFSIFETVKRMQTHFKANFKKKNNKFTMCAFFGDSNHVRFAEPCLEPP